MGNHRIPSKFAALELAFGLAEALPILCVSLFLAKPVDLALQESGIPFAFRLLVIFAAAFVGKYIAVFFVGRLSNGWENADDSLVEAIRGQYVRSGWYILADACQIIVFGVTILSMSLLGAGWWIILGTVFLLTNLACLFLTASTGASTRIPNEAVRARVAMTANREQFRLRCTIAESGRYPKCTRALQTVRLVLHRHDIDQFNDDELEALIQHELGHAVHWDSAKEAVIAACLVSATLYGTDALLTGFLGISRSSFPAYALPALMLSLWFYDRFLCWGKQARRFLDEFAADRYAVQNARSRHALASALLKMAGTQPRTPYHWLVESKLCSHPPVRERLRRIEQLA